MGLDFAPVLLRLALGVVFVYAGAGKLFYTMPLSGPGAARLVSLGLSEAPKAAPSANPEPDAVPTPVPPPPAVPNASPEPSTASPESPEPETETPASTPPADAPVGGPPALPPPTDLARQGAPGETQAKKKPSVTVELPPETETPAAFEGEITVSRRLGLVLAMDGAAQRSQWPSGLSSASALDAMAWAAALTEFIGGWLVLLGLMTRIWALGLAGTMGVALWLTQIGPAMAAGGAFLGFLPPLAISDPARWTTAWETMFFQLTLMCAGGALVLLGGGRLSLDRALFGGGEARDAVRPGVKRPGTMPR